MLAREHLPYEIAMLFATDRLLRRRPYASRTIKNALLESFGIHARNLLKFFCGEADVKPRDLTIPSYIPAAKSDRTEELLVKINKMVQIDFARTEESREKFHEREEILKFIDEERVRFEASLTPHYRAIWGKRIAR